MRGETVRSAVTTGLELAGLSAVVGGIFVLAGLGAALVAGGAAALVMSWRLSS